MDFNGGAVQNTLFGLSLPIGYKHNRAGEST